MDKIGLGKELARIRKAAGFSQAALADATGVGYSHIARIETGRLNVGVDTLNALAEKCGYTLELKKIDGDE